MLTFELLLARARGWKLAGRRQAALGANASESWGRYFRQLQEKRTRRRRAIQSSMRRALSSVRSLVAVLRCATRPPQNFASACVRHPRVGSLFRVELARFELATSWVRSLKEWGLEATKRH